jgi:hypothetical protein
MEYQFESLGPDRFQQFCQALLLEQYPNMICFPIAQPDGGRDAMAVFAENSSNYSVVFQVKYVRKPLAETDPHKWLLEIIENELPKIKELIPRGVTKYYLLTNVPGTSHLDSGSIDKARNLLDKEIPIPSECWWRDDISRRLDGTPELRWAYPELISGIDILKQLVESGLTEYKERRISTIKSFLRDQYELEKEVRFKQVELQNKLLDLFIDVPITMRDGGNKSRQGLPGYFHRLLMRHGFEEDDIDIYNEIDDSLYIGAATFLLDNQIQKQFPITILEGAPGQGKSTITQYVCQVHRMRILNEIDDLNLVSEQHRLSPVRIPIRVDLRDLATWLNKKNPFSSDESGESFPNWHKSLEAFLAAFISHYSGGNEFSVADLLATLKQSSVFLAFDGLDEIADISRRQEVVDEITRGINRLKENTVSLQVVVTSRPAAFANSPGFSIKSFPHCQLESLNRHLINEYADRWLKARKLQGRESGEIRKILRDKLDQPHLRDLAKNPMQLAILLSLIHNRGESLPDKRTELYDSYVELFFSREAQKSPVVREHRDLLINIHRYLAWVLQSEVEEGRHRGSVSAERLEKLLEDYLMEEGHDISLAKKLFTGMVERVVALVSRVEGTYEFEVQPLREYFAARHLYETAPYSPPGSPRHGHILDRFDAISRNFYWLNVTRFYAGCFSIGELPSLADRLEELTKDERFSLTNHPHYLASTLLSDWVFTQHPKSMKNVVSLILDGLGMRLLLNSSSRRSRASATSLLLPKQCGGNELVSQCFNILRSNPNFDYALDIIDLIKLNADPTEILTRWLEETSNATGNSKLRWVDFGFYLGALPQSNNQNTEKILKDSSDNPEILALMYRARKISVFDHNEARFNSLVKFILDRKSIPVGNRKIETSLDQLSHSFDSSRYSLSFDMRQPIALDKIWESSRRYVNLERDISQKPNFKASDDCQKIIEIAIQESKRTALEWASELTPWDNLIEGSRSLFGDQWCIYHLANISSGIKSTKETCADYDELRDSGKSLARRARYARLRAGNSKWWERQFEGTQNPSHTAFASLVLLTWGSQRTLVELISQIGDAIESLPRNLWVSLTQSMRQSFYQLRRSDNNGVLSFSEDDLPNTLSPRLTAIMGVRTQPLVTQKLYLKYLSNYSGNDTIILGFCQQAATYLLQSDPTNWGDYLRAIELSYSKGSISRGNVFYDPTRVKDIPLQAAQTISKHPDMYPGNLVTMAESVCRDDVAKKIIPVGVTARKDNWFNE